MPISNYHKYTITLLISWLTIPIVSSVYIFKLNFKYKIIMNQVVYRIMQKKKLYLIAQKEI